MNDNVIDHDTETNVTERIIYIVMPPGYNMYSWEVIGQKKMVVFAIMCTIHYIANIVYYTFILTSLHLIDIFCIAKCLLVLLSRVFYSCRVLPFCGRLIVWHHPLTTSNKEIFIQALLNIPENHEHMRTYNEKLNKGKYRYYSN